MRVAVVGGGLSGLVAAHEVARSGGVRVTLYEKEGYLGGAKTVAVDGGAAGRVVVNLGLMVFNPVTSPNLMEWFERLGVEMDASDMSFSASIRSVKGKGFEWGSRNGMSSVLAQKSNLLSPRFWLIIHEIFKFKNHVLKYMEDHEKDLDWNETFGQFIQSNRYSQLFQDAYLIPVCACIWSSPTQRILGFPALFVLSFFRDNQLLEFFSRSQWLTVKGGLGSCVNKVREELESNGCQIKIGCEVSSILKCTGAPPREVQKNPPPPGMRLRDPCIADDEKPPYLSVDWCDLTLNLGRPFFNRRMARSLHQAVLAAGDTSAHRRRVLLRLYLGGITVAPVQRPTCNTIFLGGSFCTMTA